MMDIGVSSPQLDTPARGFSFYAEGPLDMRMNPAEGQSAAHWLNAAEEGEIAQVLWMYGEEKHARRIAKAIVSARPVPVPWPTLCRSLEAPSANTRRQKLFKPFV